MSQLETLKYWVLEINVKFGNILEDFLLLRIETEQSWGERGKIDAKQPNSSCYFLKRLYFFS